MDRIEYDPPDRTSLNLHVSARLIASSAALILLLPIPLSAGAVLPGNPDCSWQPGFETNAATGDVLAMAVFDDGSGPALYAGGRFLAAAGIRVNFIARWDGASWSALGDAPNLGVDDPRFAEVRALAVFNDGSGDALYVGGAFETAGGVTVNNIAKWDGSSWSALGDPAEPGVSGFVRALAVYDDGSGPALYVGGQFCQVDGSQVQGIARWESGGSWSSLAGPGQTGLSNCWVESLSVWNDGSGEALYIGGRFPEANGVTVNNLVRWDGLWSPLSGSSLTGVEGRVSEMTVYDDGDGANLYVTNGSEIQSWDGTEWSLLGPAVNSSVSSMTVHDDGNGPRLFVGGDFTTIGGVEAHHTAAWDGATWSPLSGPSGNGTNAFVAVWITFDPGSGPTLFAGGRLRTAGGKATGGIAAWTGADWFPVVSLVGAGLDGPVRTFEVFDDGSGPALYAGGDFAAADGGLVNGLAKWNGTAWTALHGPFAAGVGDTRYFSVRDIEVFDDGSGGGPALYVAGSFSSAGGVAANNVARWDGSSWSALSAPSGNGTDHLVLRLAVFDDGRGPALYAGGIFRTAGGITANGIARWDGSGWQPLSGPSGTGVNQFFFPEVRDMTVFDDGSGSTLFVGGRFETAGGVAAANVARWDGSTWGAVGDGLGNSDEFVETMAIFDDGDGPALYAGGNFVLSGGVLVNNLARLDGSAWSPLSSSLGVGLDSTVFALEVFDDATGPGLFAGLFYDSTGVFNGVARRSGSEWAILDGPAGTGLTSPFVSALRAYSVAGSRELFVGGGFSYAGGLLSGFVGRYSCPSDHVFSDDFESGNLSAWSQSVP